MERYTTKLRGYWIALVCLISMVACKKVPIGYLDASRASFPSKEVTISKAGNADKLATGRAWTSLRIQGVAGTSPLRYSLISVRGEGGANAQLMEEGFRNGQVLVDGGMVVLLPQLVEKLPNGSYTLSLNVSNEDHSSDLRDILTFIITD